MQKLFTLFSMIIMSLCVQDMRAQYTLEQIDLSPLGTNFNTFPMGLNNKGYVCGYRHNTITNDTLGFVITPTGKVMYITDAITGAGSYGIKAVDINDSNMVLVNYTDAGGISRLHKVFVNDHLLINDWPITANLNQNNVKAFHMNNKGDITGWYQGVGNRWMFTLHHGTPPAGFNEWQAWRYNVYVNPNYTYYNTMAGAMDTNRVVAGFYIDGSQNIPFLYEELYAQFYPLNGSTWCHPWGKNNKGKICGEYKNGAGFVNAFIASPTYTPGNVNSGQLNLTTLNTLFHDPNTQSIARAINDSNEVVGSFIDPVNGNWVGFMYRPNAGKYEIKNYSFNKHVWQQLANNTGTPGSGNVWTSNFYGGFNYTTVDPFANNGYALIENHISNDAAIQANFNNAQVQLGNSVCVDWNAFIKEIVNSSVYYSNSQNPATLATYRFMDKREVFLKWVSSPNGYCGGFGGICYGFAGTSAMHYVDDTWLDTKFSIGANTNLSSYTDNSKEAITAVERVYLRQFEPSLSEYGVDKYADVLPWSGMYQYKHVWPYGDSTKFRQLYVGWHTPTSPVNFLYHSIFPYKIKTPQKLPFYYNNNQEYDTLYIYDSNYPTSQTEYFLINTNRFYNTVDSVFSPQYSPAPASDFFVAFNEVSVGELMAINNSVLKKKRSVDSLASLVLGHNIHYTIKDVATQNMTTYDAAGYNNANPLLRGIAPKASRPVQVHSFLRDTVAELQISTSMYNDSIMNFTFNNDVIRMSLLRRALPGETDNATSKNRYMSYGNPDNISKTLVADFSQIDHSQPQSCIISLSNLVLAPHDSIITLSPADYQYQVIHPANDTLTYTLNVIAIYNDTVKQFSASGIPVNGNTSHIIDPYFNGVNGLQTAVLVDNGLNANNDDTLFVLQVPLGMNDLQKNVSYIRLYPNPASNEFNLNIQQQSKAQYRVVCTDLYGKIVHDQTIQHQGQTKQYAMDIADLQTGMYFVIVFDEKQQVLFTEKLIKH